MSDVGVTVTSGIGIGDSLGVGVGDGVGVSVASNVGDGETVASGVGVGPSDGTRVGVGKKTASSNPFLRAITSQSKVPVSWEFNSLTTKPYGVLSDTYNWPCMIEVGVVITLIELVLELAIIDENE